jgi:predicted ATP-binding protein involved in virulence
MNIHQIILTNIGPFSNETIQFDTTNSEPNIHILAGVNGTGKTTILHALASAFDYFEKDHKEHTSNNIQKRFIKTKDGKKFEEDKNSLAKSMVHISLMDEQGRMVEKISNYGCLNCNNIHQNFEKTIADNLSKSNNGNNYQSSPNNKDLLAYKNAILSKDINQQVFKFAAFGYSGYRFIETEEVQIFNNENFNPLHLALEFVKKKDGSEKQFLISNWIVSRYSKAALEEVAGNVDTAKKYRFAIEKLITCINDLTNGSYNITVETNPLKVKTEFCGCNLEFDVLPDGLRSILSWLGDLLMRLDAIPWEDKTIPVTEQKIFLFLDEIEVHLHPTWQYKILGIIKDLLPNAQIFISSHSPFILNSIDNAKIYLLENTDCKTTLKGVIKSQTGWSIQYVLNEILGAKETFGYSTVKHLKRFNEIDEQLYGGDFTEEIEFRNLIDLLRQDGEEVFFNIVPKIMRLQEKTGKQYL